MQIKIRNKLLRKYDSDFWNFLYTRRRKNKFFIYFRLSLANKLRNYYYKSYFYINKHNRLKVKFNLKYNPFFNFYNMKNINKYKFFKRGKFYVKRVSLNIFIKKEIEQILIWCKISISTL